MKLNSFYKIVIKVEDRVLTFTGKIISEDSSFITFIDKYGKTLAYNKNNVISCEEVSQ